MFPPDARAGHGKGFNCGMEAVGMSMSQLRWTVCSKDMARGQASTAQLSKLSTDQLLAGVGNTADKMIIAFSSRDNKRMKFSEESTQETQNDIKQLPLTTAFEVIISIRHHINARKSQQLVLGPYSLQHIHLKVPISMNNPLVMGTEPLMFSPQTVRKFSWLGFTADQQSVIKNTRFLMLKKIKGVRNSNQHIRQAHLN